jgi:hypothetical protein
MDLFRTKSVLAWTVLLSGSLAAAACSGDGDDKDTGVPVTPADGGEPAEAGEEMDMGITDLGRDSGIRDMGRPDPCPNGTEGCECTSTSTAVNIPFRQEDCQADLLCVEWDLISNLRIGGADPQLEGAVKTCVKPCVADGDCGANRFCKGLVFTPQTGAEKICVDRVAGYDEFCSGSRLATEMVSDPLVMDGTDQMTACEDGLACQLFQFGDSFNPDEAICMNFCQTDTDCTHPMLPYCNPRFFTSTSTTDPFIGVCSDGPHPNGAICGSSDPDKVFTIATACDSSEATCGPNADACPVCVTINLDQNNSLTPEGQGICMSPCNNMTPCFADRTCIPMFFQNGNGVCSDSCSSLPDTCPAAGSLGNGMDCLELQGGASFCTDRYTPALAPSVWSTATGMITIPGGDCVGDLNAYSFFRCPDRSTCLPTQDQGYCVFGCTPGDAMYGQTLCQDILGTMTATCTEPQMGFAICTDD